MKSLLCVAAWLPWLGSKEFGETITGLPDGVGPWGPHIPAHARLNVGEMAEGLDQCLKRIFGTLNMDPSLYLSPVLPSAHALWSWVCSGFWWMWNSTVHHCWSIHQGVSWKGWPPSPCLDTSVCPACPYRGVSRLQNPSHIALLTRESRRDGQHEAGMLTQQRAFLQLSPSQMPRLRDLLPFLNQELDIYLVFLM